MAGGMEARIRILAQSRSAVASLNLSKRKHLLAGIYRRLDLVDSIGHVPAVRPEAGTERSRLLRSLSIFHMIFPTRKMIKRFNISRR
jgi:hypothetical protein